ncbi:hypothetical protein L6164_020722 [Bauhinia variegata]|uniref:Uncharacterized protein n=1 Tax=Bauhinia variegata TaxID=167791 RepID=A0ACB9MWB5_BAUVA|nr:hypothetical protein L6164_020722 [Bauhinia variegata]
MGNNLSEAGQAGSLQLHPPQILTFDSYAKWKAHLDASKETNKLMVLDFTATWCGPCKYMDQVIQQYAAQFTGVEFIKIDADSLLEVSREYEVQIMPTFVLIKRGRVMEKVTGAKQEELQKLIEKHSK